MLNQIRQPLPESLILTDVIRIGEVSTTIQTFIRLGMVTEDGGKYFKVANYRPNALHNDTPAPNQFSLRELERAGWRVLPGKTADQDMVMFAPGSYCTISNAIRYGLLTK